MPDKVSEYYEVTVKCRQEKGYNQKTQKAIYDKFTEKYLIHAGSISAAEQIVTEKMKGFNWEWHITNVVESKIVDVFQ